MLRKTKLQLESLEQRILLAADLGLAHEDVLFVAPIADPASIDGTGNNLDNPQWGSTDAQLLRITTVEYADGISSPAGADRPSARAASNAVAAQTESIGNGRFLTDITWLWGQFIDHDIDLTENAAPAEPFPIDVPAGDPFFDPAGDGAATIALNRSVYDTGTGDAADNPRQQINQITAFLDGSVVYGSDAERADELRTFVGGKLKNEGGLLPFNEAGLPNAGGPSDTLFLAGDVRANENAALTAMHTLWVREHNRLADEIAEANPGLSDEEIYQLARAIVTAEIQVITYNEFLPALLGPDALDRYTGYDPTVDSGVSNVFSTAAYRFGHSMLSPELLRLNNDGMVIDDGNLSLRDAFFAPDEIIDNGIDSILLGAASQRAQEIDNMIVDDVRNFLFGPPGSGGFDLASLNIQRGRDHGLPDFNQARVDMGLAPVTSFAEITSNPDLQAALEDLYGDVDNIDVWVGGLAEDHLPGSNLGELFHTILVDQFARIRDGDRYWYQNVFSGKQLRVLESTKLSDVIQRNTDITDLRENVFFDSSVLYHKVAAGHRSSSISIVVTADEVKLVDAHRRHVIESRPLADVSQIVLIGSDTRRDSFTIDIRTQADSLPPIVVYGGAGRGDKLTLRGTRAADTIIVDGRSIEANGQAIDQSGFELLRILSGPGDDDVQVIDDGGSRVVVDQGPRRHHSPRNRGHEKHDHHRQNDDAQDKQHKQYDHADGDRRGVKTPRAGNSPFTFARIIDEAIDIITCDVANQWRRRR